MTALVGHGGSGKSTLMSTIPRIYAPKSGKILIDEQVIDEIIAFFKEQISIVDQNTTLFDDTVLNNINMPNLMQQMMKFIMLQS